MFGSSERSRPRSFAAVETQSKRPKLFKESSIEVAESSKSVHSNSSIDFQRGTRSSTKEGRALVDCFERCSSDVSWVPKIPKVVDLENGPVAIESGVSRNAFESFFDKAECKSVGGYRFEWCDGTVFIFEALGSWHEHYSGNFIDTLKFASVRGGWGQNCSYFGSSRLLNPNIHQSNWEPDQSFMPKGRVGPVGYADTGLTYPSLVIEVADSESERHVFAKAGSYLHVATNIQYVIVILIRRKEAGPEKLQLFKFVRGRDGPTWRCLLGNPACSVAGDVGCQLRLRGSQLFEGAPIPHQLAGVRHVMLDLFEFKSSLDI